MLSILSVGNDFFPCRAERGRLARGRRHGQVAAVTEVQCPTCFEVFEVAVPSAAECPCEVDYDCEICCRPLVIVFDEDGSGWARGLGDL
jgi:hypothetical protein